jgi:hypothetical protein
VFSEVYFKKMIFRSKGRVHSEAGDFIRRLFALGILRVMCSDYIQCASCSFLLLSVPGRCVPPSYSNIGWRRDVVHIEQAVAVRIKCPS